MLNGSPTCKTKEKGPKKNSYTDEGYIHMLPIFRWIHRMFTHDRMKKIFPFLFRPPPFRTCDILLNLFKSLKYRVK